MTNKKIAYNNLHAMMDVLDQELGCAYTPEDRNLFCCQWNNTKPLCSHCKDLETETLRVLTNVAKEANTNENLYRGLIGALLAALFIALLWLH